MSKNRKIILVIIGIILAVGIVAVGYFLRAKAPGTDDGTGTLPGAVVGDGTGQNPSQPNTGTGGAAAPGARALSDGPVLDYFVDRSGAFIFVALDGKVGKLSQGKTDFINNAPVSNLYSVKFSPDGRKLLALLKNGTAFSISIFDIETQKWKAFAINTASAVWSPLSNEIAYFLQNADKNTLSLLNINTPDAKPRTLITLRGYDFRLSWSILNHILISQIPSAFSSTDIWGYDIAKKVLYPILTGKLGAEVLFNEQTNEGLLFTADASNQGGNLRIIDIHGTTKEQFSFLTIPEKCAFSSRETASTTASFLYCAIPRDARTLARATLPDDYLKRAVFTVDNIHRIDLQNGGINDVFTDSKGLYDAHNIKVFGNRVLFQNRFDDRVYEVVEK